MIKSNLLRNSININNNGLILSIFKSKNSLKFSTLSILRNSIVSNNVNFNNNNTKNFKRFFNSTHQLNSQNESGNSNNLKSNLSLSHRPQNSSNTQPNTNTNNNNNSSSTNNTNKNGINPQDPLILQSIEAAIARGEIQPARISMFYKILSITVPFLLLIGGYIAFNTYNDKPVFLPLWFTKTFPLDKAKGIEKIDVDKLQSKTEDILLERLSMNNKIIKTFGLPLLLGKCDKFDVMIEYKNYVMQGLQIDARNWPPTFEWCTREVIVPENLNNYLEPLGPIDGNIKESEFGLFDQSTAHNVRDYNIVLTGRIPVIPNENSTFDEGSINFVGLITFDHTKTIKLINILMAYKENGNATVEQVW
ncbi:hypothetical protein B5S29_g4219 [[Candida] boidinii]|nr:hypothetical protein B5S29_g4219 [[Candida] boidinii]